MKDSTLHNLLGKLTIPPLKKAAQEKARYHAAIAFANRAAAEDGVLAACAWRKLALGLSLVSLVAIGFWAAPLLRSEINTDARLLVEMESLFPGQLDGVICSNGNVDLDIAPETSRPNPKQALALTLRRGKQIVRVLGFSGRKVCINLDGRKHCLEPLITGEGRIIVAGDDFVWTSAQSSKVAGYQMEARILSL